MSVYVPDMPGLHCPGPGYSTEVPSSPRTGHGSMLQLLSGPSAPKLAVLGVKSVGNELSRAIVAGPTGSGEGLQEQQAGSTQAAGMQTGETRVDRQVGQVLTASWQQHLCAVLCTSNSSVFVNMQRKSGVCASLQAHIDVDCARTGALDCWKMFHVAVSSACKPSNTAIGSSPRAGVWRQAW
jgi:hypothetical protein